ncbi:ATP-binding protein [Spirosoma aerophilum]
MKQVLALFLILLFQYTYGQNAIIPELRHQLAQARHDTVRIRLYIQLSSLYSRLETPLDSAYKMAWQGLSLARRYRLPIAESELHKNLGYYYKRKSQYAKAQASYLTGLQLISKNKATPLRWKLLNHLASVYGDQGMYQKVIQTSIASLNVAEELRDSIFTCYSLQLLTLASIDLNELPKALAYARRLDQLSKQVVARHPQNQALNTTGDDVLAIIYDKTGQYALAQKCLTRSLAYFIAQHDELQINEAVIRLGNNLIKQKRSVETIRYLNESFRKKLIPYPVSDTYEIYALAYQQLGKSDTALVYGQKAYQLALGKGYLKQIQSTLSTLIRLEESQKRYPAALAHLRQLNAINDSLFTAEKAKAVAQVEAQYQVTQKQQTIELLQKDAALRRLTLKQNQKELDAQQQRQLFLTVFALLLILVVVSLYIVFRREKRTGRLLAVQKADIEEKANQLLEINRLKDKLFGVIGHDLRSPLAALKIQLANLVRTSPALTTGNTRLTSVQHLADGLYNTTDNLLNWSLLQRGGLRILPTSFHLNILAEPVLDLFSSQIQQKQLQITTRHEPALITADEYQLQIVVRNLLHNAIKFTPTGGSISIQTGQQRGRGVLQIVDSGIGMSVNKLQQVRGSLLEQTTVSENSSGLGLEICREFIRLNQGDFSIQSEPGRGTTVRIEFNLTLPGQSFPSPTHLN